LEGKFEMNLKETLSRELDRLKTQRDTARAQSVVYKEAGEALDKQVNRLQHFLADFDTMPDPNPETQRGEVKTRRGGLQTAVLEYLKTMYPDAVRPHDVAGEVQERGFSKNSIMSCLDRLVTAKRIEKSYDPEGRRIFRFIMRIG
jgi:hypothetical protein